MIAPTGYMLGKKSFSDLIVKLETAYRANSYNIA
jgi:hypothetical protein